MVKYRTKLQNNIMFTGIEQNQCPTLLPPPPGEKLIPPKRRNRFKGKIERRKLKLNYRR